jgi:hypothetical protein
VRAYDVSDLTAVHAAFHRDDPVQEASTGSGFLPAPFCGDDSTNTLAELIMDHVGTDPGPHARCDGITGHLIFTISRQKQDEISALLAEIRRANAEVHVPPH